MGCDPIIDGRSALGLFDPTVYEHVNDWEGGPASKGWATPTGAGGTATVTANQVDNNHPGVLRLRCTNAAGSRAAVRLDTESFVMGANAYLWEAWIQYVSWQTSTGQSFDGFGNAGTLSSITNRIGFFIDDNSGNIFAQCEAASTLTSVDTGVAVAGAGTWVHAKWIGTSSSVLFMLDDTLVATITTNIPAANICPVHAAETDAGGGVGNIDKFIDLTHVKGSGLAR